MISRNNMHVIVSFHSRFSIILFLMAGLSQSTHAQNNCVLQKDQDSIKVFTCHSSESRFKTIKATFTVDATYADLEKTLLDITHYTEWQYNTVEAKILKTINDREIIYYTQISAPWPVSNRDMIVHFKTQQQQPGAKDKIIITNGEPDFIPHKPDLVRVPSSKATWIIKELGKERLSIIYSIEIDPGGSVPAWMVNMVCAEAPYVSFKNLKDRMRRSKKD